MEEMDGTLRKRENAPASELVAFTICSGLAKHSEKSCSQNSSPNFLNFYYFRMPFEQYLLVSCETLMVLGRVWGRLL